MDRIIKDNRFHLYDARNPAIGTGLLMGADTVFGSTSALLSHWNPASSGMNHVPTGLLLRVSNAGVATASFHVLVALDIIDRHSSGGTPLVAADREVNDKRASVAEIHAGALVTVAEGAAVEQLLHREVKAAALAVGDEFQFDFDEERGGIDLGKVAMQPGVNMVLHAWAPAQTTPPQFEIAYRWREVQVRT